MPVRHIYNIIISCAHVGHVMIALPSLHYSDKMLFSGAYKLLVTHLSPNSGVFSGVYENGSCPC